MKWMGNGFFRRVEVRPAHKLRLVGDAATEQLCGLFVCPWNNKKHKIPKKSTRLWQQKTSSPVARSDV